MAAAWVKDQIRELKESIAILLLDYPEDKLDEWEAHLSSGDDQLREFLDVLVTLRELVSNGSTN